MDHINLIAAKMEQVRWERGISVAELARRIGVDRKRLWRVLNGERAMRQAILLYVDRLLSFFLFLNLELIVLVPMLFVLPGHVGQGYGQNPVCQSLSQV